MSRNMTYSQKKSCGSLRRSVKEIRLIFFIFLELFLHVFFFLMSIWLLAHTRSHVSELIFGQDESFRSVELSKQPHIQLQRNYRFDLLTRCHISQLKHHQNAIMIKYITWSDEHRLRSSINTCVTHSTVATV